jgi:hypothetical protein
MQASSILLLAAAVAVAVTSIYPVSAAPRACPLTNTTNMIFSTVDGVGPASKIWVEDLLWWWQQSGDSSIDYLAVSAADLQVCDLASYPNLKVWCVCLCTVRVCVIDICLFIE